MALKEIEFKDPRFQKELLKQMKKILEWMRNRVKSKRLSGQVLNAITGNLKRSIHTKLIVDQQRGMVGKMFVGRNAWYGKIHEYGGVFRVKAHSRTITKAFGKELPHPVTMRVKSHKIKFPERAFMRPTLAEAKKPFKKLVRMAIKKIFGKTKKGA